MAKLSEEEISEKLSVLISAGELTRQDIINLTARSGVTVQSVRDWMNGKSGARVPKTLYTLCEDLDELNRRVRIRRWIGPCLKLSAVGLWIYEMWESLGWSPIYALTKENGIKKCVVTAKHENKKISVTQDIAATDAHGIYLITTFYPNGVVLSCFLDCRNPVLGVKVLQDYFFNIKGDDSNGLRRRITCDFAWRSSALSHIERAGSVEVCKWHDNPAAIHSRVIRGQSPSGTPHGR